MASIARGIPANSVLESERPAIVAPQVTPLTPREMDVLRLMADGLTTREIATQLNMRFKTAACHRNRILQKVGVKSTVSAVRWAFRQGLIEL
jgi:DNA-binding NarL/FixJ family response regulator